jgi:hypothetical protein
MPERTEQLQVSFQIAREETQVGEEGTYQSARSIDAGVTGPGAVHPFGLAEFPESVLGHDVCLRAVKQRAGHSDGGESFIC